MNPLTASILARHDNGETVEQIRIGEGCGFGYVYSVLREHRPDRGRQPRTRTSKKRKLIIGLLATRKISAARIAFLAKCSPAYVYRLSDETKNAAV